MEYNLRIGQDTQSLNVAIEEEHRLRIASNDKEFEVLGAVVSEHQLHLTVNGKGVNAFIADEKDGGKTVVLNGASYCVEDADTFATSTRRVKGAGTLPQEVTPPMPAVVVSLLVNVGDCVTKGDDIIVVTAMKMETTLLAPYDGKISCINVAEGDKVMPGDILVAIEK